MSRAASASVSASGMRAAPQMRIETLAQSFADQIDRDEQDAKRQAGREADPWRLRQEIAALCDHQTPLAGGGLWAQAKKRQGRTQKDRERHAQPALYDDWRPGVG